MEIANIIYKAKDGRTFTDPLACEEYEKTLGVIPCSVGDLIQELEKRNPNDYIFGIVFIKGNDKNNILLIRTTICLDGILEDYVNLENLTEEQRYLSETIGVFLCTLRKMDKDAPCQWWIIHSKDISLKGAGMMANYNEKCWAKQNIQTL